MPKSEVVGSISLYGTHATGFGWLATAETRDGKVRCGDGEPRSHRSATDAVWLAAGAIGALVGDWHSNIEIHIDTPSGPLMATAPLFLVPAFGDLKFGPGRSYTVSAEEIERDADQRAYNAHWTARVPEFCEDECGGAFDGGTVTSDAGPGL